MDRRSIELSPCRGMSSANRDPKTVLLRARGLQFAHDRYRLALAT